MSKGFRLDHVPGHGPGISHGPHSPNIACARNTSSPTRDPPRGVDVCAQVHCLGSPTSSYADCSPSS
eukprot:7830204-Pyramimonas_sp.AAC.1